MKKKKMKPLSEGFIPPKLPMSSKDSKKGFIPPNSKPPKPSKSKNSRDNK